MPERECKREAAGHAELCLGATSEDLHAIGQLIDMASRDNRVDDAIGLARRAVAVAPVQSWHRVRLANLLIRGGYSGAARAEAAFLLSQDRRNVEAMRLMREAAAAEHDLQAAIAWGMRLLEASPHDARHRHRLINLLLSAGDVPAARAHIDLCLDADANDETAGTFLFRLEARQRQVSRQARRHLELTEELQGKNPAVLFIGDSIFEQWLGAGRDMWRTCFVPLKSANIGISGETTRDVLNRLRKGALCDAKPNLTLLLIGTNDAARTPTRHVAGRIMDVVNAVRDLLPNTKLVLLGLLPREAMPDAPLRQAVMQINADLCRLARENDIVYAQTGTCLLTSEGVLTPEISPDALHLSSEGYARWAPVLLCILRNNLAVTVNSLP